MLLKQTRNKKTGRTYLSIVEGYRDPATGKIRQRNIRSLGYADALAAEHEDPVAWGRELARSLTREREEEKAQYRVSLSPGEKIGTPDGSGMVDLKRNIGYLPFSKLYHQLEIDEFWNDRRRYRRFRHNVNSVFKCLVFNRILFPESKAGAWKMRNIFFEDGDFELHDVYNSLSYFLEHRKALLQRLDRTVRKRYGRDDLLLYYDVTNYYFEIDRNDEDELGEDGKVVREGLRKEGCSKENRRSPIVQMGLFMSENQLPVTYELFRGNMNDCQTFPLILDEATEDLGQAHRIIVADKGMMTGDNIAKIHLGHNGYVISHSVRKADRRFVDWVLDEDGYTEGYDPDTRELEFKTKSRIWPRAISVSARDRETGERTGRKSQCMVNERQIVVWSRKYYEKTRREREKAIGKIKKMAGGTSADAKTMTVGARKYLRKDPVSRDGEILEPETYIVSLDEERIREEEALDGYYVICTNVVGVPDDPPRGWRPLGKGQRFRYNDDGFFELDRPVSDSDILDMYSGLWKIEETFKVTKSDLNARPVFVWTPEHIRAHFLICFVSLLLMRLQQFRLGWRHSASALQDSLAKATGVPIPNSNIYTFSYFDKVLEDVGKDMGIDFDNRILTVRDILTMVAATKKK